MVTIQEKPQLITQLPDGPRAHPLIQTFQTIFRPLECLESDAQRYGDLFTLRFSGLSSFIVVSNPQAIQEIFAADSQQFASGDANRPFFRSFLGDHSLLLMDGERHQRERKLLTPPFHGERMRAYGQQIRQLSEQVINQWQIGKSFSARASMQDITLQVILRVVFGIHEGSRFQQLRQLLGEMLDITGSPLRASLIFIPFLQKDLGAWSPWGRYLRLKQQVNDLIYQEIRERRGQDNSAGEDVLSLMMSARDEQGQPMTDVELHDELMTLLVAGHETTATALAWALYWIHRQPEVREQLLKELDALDADVDPSVIMKLPYLNAVCSETLRIYPVGLFAFSRIVQSPFQLMGYEFAPGSILAPCIYLVHHREDLYPEPKKFKPERFLERQFAPYEFLPFGGGNRRCIGLALALYEMKIVLATILSKVQLKLANNRPVKPARRGLTMAPAGGVHLVMTGLRGEG